MIGTYSHLGMQQRSIGCNDYEEIVVSGTIVTLTLAKIRKATYAFMRVLDGPVRVTIHPNGVPVQGVAPLGFGFTVFDGDNFVLNKQEMLQFAAIAQAAVDGLLQVAYYDMDYPSAPL